VIREFSETISGKATSPAANHMFKIREEEHDKHLSEKEGVIYHHTVPQLLFLSTRARRDIHTAVSFLITRVNRPADDDWGKLKRLRMYLKYIRRLKPTLTVESLGVIKWFVDGSHNTHWDCKGHGGTLMTLGKGAVSSYSRKIKLNTRSSTETELVAVDTYMPEML